MIISETKTFASKNIGYCPRNGNVGPPGLSGSNVSNTFDAKSPKSRVSLYPIYLIMIKIDLYVPTSANNTDPPVHPADFL